MSDSRMMEANGAPVTAAKGSAPRRRRRTPALVAGCLAIGILASGLLALASGGERNRATISKSLASSNVRSEAATDKEPGSLSQPPSAPAADSLATEGITGPAVPRIADGRAAKETAMPVSPSAPALTSGAPCDASAIEALAHADKDSFRQGEEVTVTARFMNRSGRDCELPDGHREAWKDSSGESLCDRVTAADTEPGSIWRSGEELKLTASWDQRRCDSGRTNSDPGSYVFEIRLTRPGGKTYAAADASFRIEGFGL